MYTQQSHCFLQVRKFWSKVGKVVEYKEQQMVNALKKKVCTGPSSRDAAPGAAAAQSMPPSDVLACSRTPLPALGAQLGSLRCYRAIGKHRARRTGRCSSLHHTVGQAMLAAHAGIQQAGYQRTVQLHHCKWLKMPYMFQDSLEQKGAWFHMTPSRS